MAARPSPPRPATEPTPRRVAFEFPDDLQPAWSPRNAEFSFAADSVSLLMPYAEPYFIRSVRAALPHLEDPRLADRASAYARQEAQHHRQHRRFNDLLVARRPRLARLERWMDRTYGWLGRTRSLRFNLAFAAASEAIAFALARWAVRNLSAFFDGSDPVAGTVFLWHLAEEVEHKSVAFDVWEAVDGSRVRYALAMLTTFGILAWFTAATMFVLLTGDRLLRRPATHLRLARLSTSFAFQCLPDLAASALPHHHPTDFADPPWLTEWLRTYDPDTSTMPLWTDGVGRAA